MNTLQDALRALKSAQNLNELKQLYRVFALQFHPDHGGNEQAMKQINIQFSWVFDLLKNRQNNEAARAHDAGNWAGYSTTTETPEEFIDIISKLDQIQGIIVELCGRWLWISGSTLKNREALKACGCQWSPIKKMWYWRHEEDFYRKHNGNSMEIEEIRAHYGSQRFTRQASAIVAV
jgi:curved DNA-binding protein CbpA